MISLIFMGLSSGRIYRLGPQAWSGACLGLGNNNFPYKHVFLINFLQTLSLQLMHVHLT
jgi:hypothetical protein